MEIKKTLYTGLTDTPSGTEGDADTFYYQFYPRKIVQYPFSRYLSTHLNIVLPISHFHLISYVILYPFFLNLSQYLCIESLV